MATMIERVARAIDPKGWADFEAYCARKEYDDREIAEERSRAGRVQISLAQSRAAIAAMRCTTNEMDVAGCIHLRGFPTDASGCFSSMIDAALEEKP